MCNILTKKETSRPKTLMFPMVAGAGFEPIIARLCRLTSCGAQNWFNAAVAATNFDRGASFCSLHHPPGALATSPREPLVVGSSSISIIKTKTATVKVTVLFFGCGSRI